jgi:hypothetical protein
VPSCVSRPNRAFRFNSFLLDAAAAPSESSLAQPLRPQHSRLVVRLLSHSLSPIPSNSARTRPFVLTTSPSRAPLSVSKRRKRTLRPAAASGHLPPPPSADSTPHILRKPPHDRGRGALCACYSHDETVPNVLHTRPSSTSLADYQPTRLQTVQGIQRLTKNLAPFGLTKAEKLQIVNLTSVEPVEPYVVRSSPPPLYSSFVHISLRIVEELEDRLGNCMEEVLGLVWSSLTVPPPSSSPATAIEAELALPMQLPLEIVDETPTGHTMIWIWMLRYGNTMATKVSTSMLVRE